MIEAIMALQSLVAFVLVASYDALETALAETNEFREVAHEISGWI